MSPFNGSAKIRTELSRRVIDRTEIPAGFTLVELLVVLAIMALLAGLVAPRVVGFLGSANVKASQVQLGNVEAGIDLYRLDVGVYPSTLQDLVARPAEAPRWNGPYFKKESALVDPWGNPYVYKFPGDHGDYDLSSLGADGAEGGDGENQDVRNW